MRRYDDKNKDYLQGLYEEQSGGMYRYACSILKDEYDAEVAVQETFAVAWDKMDSITMSPSPVGWLFEVLKNIIKRIQSEHYRIQKRIVALSDIAPDSLQAPDDANPELLLEGVIAGEELNLLHMLYIQGYTYKELAEYTNLPLSTLGMRVKRAKEKFRKFYK